MAQEPNSSQEQPGEGPAEQSDSGLDGPFTKFPHALTDQWMQVLSGDGWKVLSFVARQTIGWHRPTAFISLSEFMEGTGLPTRTVVLRAIREVCALGAIVVSESVGYRGVKAYGIPPSALTGLPAVPVNNPRKMQRTGRTTGTRLVPELVPPRDQNQYQGDTSSSTSLVLDTPPQPSLGAVPQEPKERIKKSKDRSKEIVRYDRSLELQNEMQKASEHTNTTCSEESITTQPDLPDSSAALASHQASLESTGLCPPSPPDHAPPAAGEEAVEVAARHQRLLALQRELAQLKRTPSMQLLARQRIPRLEAEIKQLMAALQESA